MKKVAAIILNRNLPEVTDSLCGHLREHDGDITDVFVVEAGSDRDKLSRGCTWYADWPEAMEHGLRYPRGMNYGLSMLIKEKKLSSYEAFFLLTNDTELEKKPTLAPLLEVMEQHPRVGILSPCSRMWGEKQLLKTEPTRYFWYIHNTAYLLRRRMAETLIDPEPDHLHCLFDGTNFRGYGTETELVAKAYANDWAAAITAKVWAEENEAHLLNKSDLIKTETYEQNIRLYIEEGRRWMRRKYGFNSRWQMQQHAKFLYDQFFEFYPEYAAYRI
ncbi:MAG: hypothetical protein RQ748_05575 [Elusimicrobiales bacterium]|nr:hypothetical protein [Elusimicrobiales bacterium]